MAQQSPLEALMTVSSDCSVGSHLDEELDCFASSEELDCFVDSEELGCSVGSDSDDELGCSVGSVELG